MSGNRRKIMRIAGIYSFNKGREIIEKKHAVALSEINNIIHSIDSACYKSKRSKEKTMKGRMLFSPIRLNKAFKVKFQEAGWQTVREKCEYPKKYHVSGYSYSETKGAFREMDFIKNKLGVELQFGKYAFMVYNVCAKMTIFNKLGHIDYGIEIVPIKELAESMSTGVSYFEQFVWDLEHRGVSDIDIPVLIYGIGA
jgi:hypothetical protein